MTGGTPGAGFSRAHITALVSVVQGYGGFLEEDMEYVLDKNKMWAYNEMKEEDLRQVRGRVRGDMWLYRLRGERDNLVGWRCLVE